MTRFNMCGAPLNLREESLDPALSKGKRNCDLDPDAIRSAALRDLIRGERRSESGFQGSCHTHNIELDAPRTAPSSGAGRKAAVPWRPGFPTGIAMYCLPSTM